MNYKHMEVKCDELLIWSDNPRIDLASEISKEFIPEDRLISVIYEQVGKSHMLALEKSIKSDGVMESQLPIVVYDDIKKKYLVYDGNRRIAVLKKIKYENNIHVVCTSHEIAMRDILKIHAPKKKGVGVIQWDTWMRDKNLASLNEKPKYPRAYDFAKSNCLKTKNDFKDIPYTDLETILTNNRIKNIFKQKKLKSDKEKYEYLVLLRNEQNIPFSRLVKEINNNDNLYNNIIETDLQSPPIKNKRVFSLSKNYYEICNDESHCIMDLLSFTGGRPKMLSQFEIIEKEKYDILDKDFSIHKGVCAGNYDFEIIYSGYTKSFTVSVYDPKPTIYDYASKSDEGEFKSILNDFANNCYDGTKSIYYYSVKYVIDGILNDKIDNSNKYAYLIVLRQVLEFSLKLYGDKSGLKLEGSNLEGMLNAVSNSMEQRGILNKSENKTTKKAFKEIINVMQTNAHNILDISITPSCLRDYTKVICFFIYKVHVSIKEN